MVRRWTPSRAACKPAPRGIRCCWARPCNCCWPTDGCDEPTRAGAFQSRTTSAGSLPRSLHDAVGDRAARLSLDTKQALAAAAVLGREVEFELLQRASGMESLLLLDCVDEALRAEFLVEHPTSASMFQFVHDRVRDAIVARLPERERVELHRRIAAALNERCRTQPELEADLGHHLRAAGELGAAQAAYERGGRHAWAAQAFARAADLLGEALDLAQQLGESARPRADRAARRRLPAMRPLRGRACRLSPAPAGGRGRRGAIAPVARLCRSGVAPGQQRRGGAAVRGRPADGGLSGSGKRGEVRARMAVGPGERESVDLPPRGGRRRRRSTRSAIA